MTAEDATAFAEDVLKELEGRSAPERRAGFVGLLERHLPEGSEAILVGGALVELLTEGQYVTGDVDLIGDPTAIEPLLEQAGFEARGRLFVQEELGLAVEIVAGHLDPSRRSERIQWRGYTLNVLSIEDLIIDRLCAAKFWESVTDHEQALLVYTAHQGRLDLDRLRARAREEQVEDLLERLEGGS